MNFSIKFLGFMLSLTHIAFAQKNNSKTITVRKNNHCIGVEQPALNVLYRGIENPIHVVYSGNCELKLNIDKGIIIDKLEGDYSVFVNEGSLCEISIFEKRGKELKCIGVKKYRIKSVPDPLPTFAGKRNGEEISKALMMQGSLAVNLENFLYDIRFEIVSFSVSFNFYGDYKTSTAFGNNFTAEQLSWISKAKNASRIIIEDIKVREQGGKGSVRTLPSITLRISG